MNYLLSDRLHACWKSLGIKIPSVRKLMASMKELRRFFTELRRFSASGSAIPITRLFPILFERNVASGAASGHYFHQDLLVARQIFMANPEIHVDVGSRIDGFVAHVAAFRPIHVFDIRPLPVTIPNIHFIQGDLMNELDPAHCNFCDSLSCLHALEHFGLGRYGDPLAHDGHLRGFQQLKKLLKPGGTLYFSVPIGPLRIEFNAHRVFSLTYLRDLFTSHNFSVSKFSFIDDAGALTTEVSFSGAAIENNCGCNYGCGVFTLCRD